MNEARDAVARSEVADQARRQERLRQNLCAERDLVREKLESLTGKHVEITQTVDPDIIGGIVIRIGDQVIDGSVRNKLERMRQRLIAGRT